MDVTFCSFCLNRKLPNLIPMLFAPHLAYRILISGLQRVSTRYWGVAVFGDFFLRYCGICRIFLRYCGVQNPPMSPSVLIPSCCGEGRFPQSPQFDTPAGPVNWSGTISPMTCMASLSCENESSKPPVISLGNLAILVISSSRYSVWGTT